MPLARWTHYQQTRAQKEKALYLLALSGVVRPSTIELRYTISLSHISAEPLCEEQTPIAQDASPPSVQPRRLTWHSTSTRQPSAFSTNPGGTSKAFNGTPGMPYNLTKLLT